MGIREYIFLGIHLIIIGIVSVDLFKNPRFGGALRAMVLIPVVVAPIVGALIYWIIRDAEPKSYGKR